jgi:hypothetical protein
MEESTYKNNEHDRLKIQKERQYAKSVKSKQ